MKGSLDIPIDSEIYALLDSLNCTYEIENGTVIITDIHGEIWTMGEPRKEQFEFETPPLDGCISDDD